MSDHPATPFAPTSLLAPRHESNVATADALLHDDELLTDAARMFHRWQMMSVVYSALAIAAVGGAALLSGVSIGVVFIVTALSVAWFGMRATEREFAELGIAPSLARALLVRSMFVHESYEPQLFLPGKVGRRSAKRALRAALKECVKRGR